MLYSFSTCCRSIKSLIYGAILSALLVVPLKAELLDNGDGSVFDVDANIDWLANSNIARYQRFGLPVISYNETGFGIRPDGRMNWDTAMQYIQAMNAAKYLGFGDWRLPVTIQPDPSCDDQSAVGSRGYYCFDNEMAHLFYDELGGVAGQSILTSTDPDMALFHYTIEINSSYWTGTDRTNAQAWNFYFGTGVQNTDSKNTFYYIWPVRTVFVNNAPVVDAGPDQAIVTVGTLVKLDGSGSLDDDGDVLSYQWIVKQKPAGSALTQLTDPDDIRPSFVADVNGEYVIELLVSDGYVSSSDEVKVSFDQLPPIADAGVNQSVLVGTAVELSGADSVDPNLDPLTYSWSISNAPSGSVAAQVLPDSQALHLGFVPDAAGSYTFTLIVSDGLAYSSDEVTVLAISVSDYSIQLLTEITEVINSYDQAVFKNKNRRNTLTKKVQTVIEDVLNEDLNSALDKLQNDLLPKNDGCAFSSPENPQWGIAENNDWIVECEAQAEIYQRITKILDVLSVYQ